MVQIATASNMTGSAYRDVDLLKNIQVDRVGRKQKSEMELSR